jgi:hypothetical protein
LLRFIRRVFESGAVVDSKIVLDHIKGTIPTVTLDSWSNGPTFHFREISLVLEVLGILLKKKIENIQEPLGVISTATKRIAVPNLPLFQVDNVQKPVNTQPSRKIEVIKRIKIFLHIQSFTMP